MGKVTNHDIIVGNWVEFSVAVASLLCSILTLVTIVLMRTWNGYILLICSTVFFQILYDVNYILGVCPGYAACMTWNFLDILGGLGVSFWTNVISFVIMITVVKIKSFDVFKNYWKFSIFATGIPLVLSIMAMFVVKRGNADDDQPFTYCVYKETTFALAISGLYYWGRIASIVFNIGVFVYTSMRISNMKITESIDARARTALESGTASSLTTTSKPSEQAVGRQAVAYDHQSRAITTLISRIKYYPIAQVISRSGACWNSFDNYHYSTYASILLNAVTGPSLGILCFAIFLMMQPTARATLLAAMTCRKVEKAPAAAPSQLFRGSMHHFSEDDLDQLIDDDTMNFVETVENSILSQGMSTRTPTSNPMYSDYM